jgi:arylsulfatase A-like enzyme
VRTVDTVPTILDLCGIEPPRIAELDGVSLLPSIKQGRAEGLVAYMEHLHEGRVFGCQQALCTGRYKYIRSLTTGSEELYDLRYDPHEYVNLLNSSAVPFGKIRESTVLEEPVSQEKLVEWRRTLNRYLLDVPPPTRTIRKAKKALDEEGIKEVERRLASLGYIQR